MVGRHGCYIVAGGIKSSASNSGGWVALCPRVGEKIRILLHGSSVKFGIVRKESNVTEDISHIKIVLVDVRRSQVKFKSWFATLNERGKHDVCLLGDENAIGEGDEVGAYAVSWMRTGKNTKEQYVRESRNLQYEHFSTSRILLWWNATDRITTPRRRRPWRFPGIVRLYIDPK